jgi:phage replication O-like protein O
MASPQVQNGFVRIANELAKAFCRYRISGEGWQVLMAIMRQTYGYQKKEAKIRMDELEELTLLDERQIWRGLAWLKRHNIVRRDKSMMTSVNKDYESWLLSTGIVDKEKKSLTKTVVNTDKDRSKSLTKSGAAFLYRKTVGKDIKTSRTLDISGDKSEGRRRMEAARNLLAEKMTM